MKRQDSIWSPVPSPKIAIVAWVALILAMVPSTRAIQELITDHLGRNAFLLITAICLLAGAAVLIRHLARRGLIVRGLAAAAGGLAGCGALVVAFDLRPEEAIHLIEYGVLGLLVLRLGGGRAILVIAALSGAFVGLGDELLQWLTPERYFDVHDVAVDFAASIMATLVIVISLRPDELLRPSDAWARRLSWITAAATAGILCLASLLTPARADQLAGLTESLGFLRGNDAVVAAYGHRHELDIGTFRSQFELDELLQLDALHAEECHNVLPRWSSHSDFPLFSLAVSRGERPYLWEIRSRWQRVGHAMGESFKTIRASDEPIEALFELDSFDRARRELAFLRRTSPECSAAASRRFGPKVWRELDLEPSSDPGFESDALPRIIAWTGPPWATLIPALAVLFALIALTIRREDHSSSDLTQRID